MKLKWQRFLNIGNNNFERWYGLSKITQQFCYQIGLTPKSWYLDKVLSPPWWSWPFPYLPLLCPSSLSVLQDEARELHLGQGCPCWNSSFWASQITGTWVSLPSWYSCPIYVVSLWETWGWCCWSAWTPRSTQPCTSSWATSLCWMPAIPQLLAQMSNGKRHQVRVSDPSFPLKMDVKLLTF